MLELYQFESCPFCAKVRRKLDEMGLDWIARTVPADGTKRQRVIEVSGQSLVPVLVDRERNMVVTESDDICAYLEETYASNASPRPSAEV